MSSVAKMYSFGDAGMNMYTKGTSVRLRSEPNTTSTIVKTVANSGTYIGISSGYYHIATDFYKWYEYKNGSEIGWIRQDLVTLSAPSSSSGSAVKNDDTEAQQLLDEIVAQDKEIMNNLNTSAALIETLKTKGVATATSTSKLTTIMTRLQERQTAMQKTTWGKVKDTISNAWGSVKSFFGFSGFNFQRLKKSKIPMRKRSNFPAVAQPAQEIQGLGILPIVIIAGIALVAGAGTTALVLIKPWKNQSNIDLKESKELKELLENADPVVAQKIREDIKTQLVDAYTTGNRQGSVSSIFSVGKYVLIAGLALWLAPKLMDYLGGSKNR